MSYQTVNELTSFRDVVMHFQNAEPDAENMILLSTGGWHGSYKTLDDCERILKNQDKDWLPGGAYVTVLIIDTKNVSMKWGEIRLKTLSEVEWLRNKIRETLDLIPITQEANK